MSTANIPELLQFIELPHKFEVRKNFLKKSYRADLFFTASIKEPATFLIDWFLPTVKELLSFPLINIKGDSQNERLFMLSGVCSSETDSHAAGLDFSIEVKTVYAGRHSKGKYLNKTNIKSSASLSSSSSINFDELINIVKNSHKIDKCELNLEFMTEHFLTSLGLAPVIEESVSIQLNGATGQLTVVTHSDCLKPPITGPLNNKDWGQKIIKDS
jgi:hypothetical protein